MRRPPDDLAFDHARWTAVARRRWPLVLLLGTLGLGAGVALTPLLTPGYIASADVRLARDISSDTGNVQTTARAAANEMAFLDSPQLLAETASALGSDIELQATLLEGSDVARVTGSADNAEQAEDAVSALVDGYVEQRTTAQEGQLTAARELLTARLAEVGAALTEAAGEGERALLSERTELRIRLATLDEAQARSAADPLVLSQPTSRVGRSTALTTALVGLVTGLLLGVGAALLQDQFLGRVRGRDDELGTGVPGEFLVDADGRWEDLSARQRARYVAVVGHLLSEHGGEGALATVLVDVGGGVPSYRVAVRLGQALRHCGYRVLVVDLCGASNRQVAPIPVHQFYGPEGLTARDVRTAELDASAVTPAGVLNLAGVDGPQQVATMRDLLDRSRPDDVFLLVAGAVDAPDVIRTARLKVQAVLVARRGVTRLRRLRQAADRVRELELPLVGVVAVGSGRGKQRARGRADAAAGPGKVDRKPLEVAG